MDSFDATALALLVFAAATRVAAQSRVAALPNRVPTVSGRGRVDVSSLLAGGVCVRGLPSPETHAIERPFAATIDASFTILGVVRADVDGAKAWIADHGSGLRSGDALPPAISTSDHVRSFCSFDKALARSARAFGLPVDLGPPPP